MPKKFDTNPLDPDFPAKVREVETSVLPKNGYQTAEFPASVETEEQTRRFNQANFDYYSAPYVSQNVPANYNTTVLPQLDRASDRKVASIGLPEKFLLGLPYIPFWPGLIAGLVLLLVLPKSEQKVRFHAAQGLAAHLGIMIVGIILDALERATSLADIAGIIFTIVTTVMLIIFAVKAWQGKPVHIESVDDLTNWLEDKISIKK
jgi:uncharacterized membrane protein